MGEFSLSVGDKRGRLIQQEFCLIEHLLEVTVSFFLYK